MIELNVVLKLYKHLIECVEQGVNKHTFYYIIKRIEIFKDHYMIKCKYPTIEYYKYTPLILISKNNQDIINDIVIHHFMNNKKTKHVYITPVIPDKYDVCYDYENIDFAVRGMCDSI